MNLWDFWKGDKAEAFAEKAAKIEAEMKAAASKAAARREARLAVRHGRLFPYKWGNKRNCTHAIRKIGKFAGREIKDLSKNIDAELTEIAESKKLGKITEAEKLEKIAELRKNQSLEKMKRIDELESTHYFLDIEEKYQEKILETNKILKKAQIDFIKSDGSDEDSIRQYLSKADIDHILKDIESVGKKGWIKEINNPETKRKQKENELKTRMKQMENVLKKAFSTENEYVDFLECAKKLSTLKKETSDEIKQMKWKRKEIKMEARLTRKKLGSEIDKRNRKFDEKSKEVKLGLTDYCLKKEGKLLDGYIEVLMEGLLSVAKHKVEQKNQAKKMRDLRERERLKAGLPKRGRGRPKEIVEANDSDDTELSPDLKARKDFLKGKIQNRKKRLNSIPVV